MGDVRRLLYACGVITLAAPLMARGQTVVGRPADAARPSVRTVPRQSSALLAGPQFPAEPYPYQSHRIPGRVFNSGSVFPADPQVAAAPTYWIASCRRLPQELPYCGVLPLDYFARLPDGSLQPTDVPTLLSQIVPGAPVCIFIHGTFVDTQWHHKDSEATFHWIRQPAPDRPLHVISYSWPSDAGSPWPSPLLINQLGRWAENSAFYLARLIANLPEECPVCLVGHSQGARAVVATLHLLGGGAIGGYVLPYGVGTSRRYHAVLAAAAVDRHWLNPGQRYERAICRAERILNLRNPADFALHVYPLRSPLSRQALGDTGFTLWDRTRLGAASYKAIDFDVSAVIGLEHIWPAYHSVPRIAEVIAPYAYFVDH
jgi:hypothetical protein